MNKIRIYKCPYFEHHLNTLPHQTPKNQNRYAKNWREYWNEKITKNNNYIYRCKACLYIKNRNKKYNEKNLPDDYVVFKLTGEIKDKKEIKKIPRPLIEAKRAILRLNYISKNPVANCPTHGELFVHKRQVIKAGKHKNGIQTYRCKQCMKELHKEHYKNNKEKVLKAHKKYREENPEKYKEIQRNYVLKCKENNTCQK